MTKGKSKQCRKKNNNNVNSKNNYSQQSSLESENHQCTQHWNSIPFLKRPLKASVSKTQKTEVLPWPYWFSGQASSKRTWNPDQLHQWFSRQQAGRSTPDQDVSIFSNSPPLHMQSLHLPPLHIPGSIWDWQKVSTHVASQIGNFPADHGIIVTPSGQFPMAWCNPDGSRREGTFEASREW